VSRAVAEWSPQIVVDEPLARRLLGEQFPELELASIELVGEGWDNTVWRVDREWVFRFPRREIALPGVRRELAVLPELAPRLPVPVPEPVFVGKTSDHYPWPFFGAAFLAGRELADAGLDDEGRAKLARPLAEFLCALHAIEADVELPEDPNRRSDMPFRTERASQALAEVERLGLWRVPASAQAILEPARDLPVPEASAIVHGDLHLRHVLVGEAGELAAVIDWGDVCVADPCIDLVLYWCLLPPEARDEFLDVYGPVEEEQLLRARVLALHICSVLAHSGEGADVAEAIAGLERTLR
jgi:aminoglycoside phosphotransferase (APT) family kinase protein